MNDFQLCVYVYITQCGHIYRLNMSAILHLYKFGEKGLKSSSIIIIITNLAWKIVGAYFILGLNSTTGLKENEWRNAILKRHSTWEHISIIRLYWLVNYHVSDTA